MSQPRFVHIVDDVTELAGHEVGPVLLVALDGFLDAGNASELLVDQLVSDDSGSVVASFEIDEFYDYRARRPPVTFARNQYVDWEAPRLVVRLMHDVDGTAYLLLHGPEPDIRWEAFARAVRDVIAHFSVSTVISLGSVPMAVPHTRPVQLTNHATKESLLTQQNLWEGELRVPSSAQAMLEIRLGEWDLDALGFVAHVPHYVAQMPYPRASLALMQATADVSGLRFVDDELVEAADQRDSEIKQQLDDNEEVRNVVEGLERQYDAFQRASESDASLLAEGRPLPSGEELGAQFEEFLAGLDSEED